MRVGELIPITGTNFVSKSTVPAGKAARADFGIVGISLTIGTPTGETSKTSPRMPRYRAIRGNTQGTR